MTLRDNQLFLRARAGLTHAAVLPPEGDQPDFRQHRVAEISRGAEAELPRRTAHYGSHRAQSGPGRMVLRIEEGKGRKARQRHTVI